LKNPFRTIPPLSRKLKLILGVGGSIILVFFVFINFFLTPIVKKKITTSVNKSSKGLYKLEMGDFALHFWSGRVHIKKIILNQDTAVLSKLRKADSSSNLSRVKMKIDELIISRINWQNYLLDRSLEVGKIHITSPHFFIEGQIPKDTVKVSQGSFLEALPGLVASFAGSLKIKEITVEGGKFHYNLASDNGKTQQRADSISIDFKDIKIDTVPKIDVLHTSYAHFTLKDYKFISADSLYKVDIKQFKGSYTDSALTVSSITFSSLKKDPKGNHFNVHLDSVKATGINFPLFFKNKKVWLNELVINRPDIKAKYNLAAEEQSSKNSGGNSSNNRSVLQVVLPYVGNSFKINELVVSNGKINSQVINKKGFIDQSIEKLNIQLKQVYISDTTIKNGRYWKQIAIDLTEYETKVQSLNLVLKINTIKGSAEKDVVNFRDIYIGQLHPAQKGAFLIVENKIKAVKMEHVDFHYLLDQGGLCMKRMVADSVMLSIKQYSDLNKESTQGKMPNELLKTIPIYLRIDTLHIQNASIIYKDSSSKVKDEGLLTFEQTSLKVANFTNDEKAKRQPAELWLNTKVMGNGNLKLDIKMPLMSDSFNCSFTGNLGPTDARYFNSLLQYGGMRLEDGKVEAQNFDVKVINGKAAGTMLLIYHDLAAQMIKKKSGQVKKVETAIANVMLKKRNKHHKKLPPKLAKVKYNRKKSDDFLSYVWSSISDAIIKTVVKDFFEPFVPKK